MNPEVERFLREITAAANTKEAYLRALNVFGAWAGNGEGPYSAAEVQEFLDYRKGQVKPSTIALDAAGLRRFLEWKGKPVGRLEHPAVTLQAPEYLSKEEIRRLLAATDSALLLCLIALLYDTGARIGEILGIKMSGIHSEGLIDVVRKGGREDTAVMTEWGKKYLQPWLDARDWKHPLLFMDYDYDHVRRRLREVADAAEIQKFHPHMLRHSRAVHLREAGMGWEEIGYVLGHVNVAVTMRVYGRPTARDLLKNQQLVPDI